jgi:hypothetical protein
MKKEFIEEILAKEIKKIISESVSNEVYIIKNKEGDPIEQFKTQEEADKALEAYKAKHPDQELIVEPGEELSFEELDKMSEKLENMENMNEKTHKGHFTMEQVLKLAKKAGEWVLDAQDALEELCEMYGEKIPASRVFEVLDDYDMPELKSKIRVKKSEPKEDMSMDEKLYGDQDKLDVDGDGEIEASDLAALRAGKEGDTKEEEGECMECGDGYMEEEDMEDPQFGDIDKLLDAGAEEDMSEEKHTCEKCGKEICECGDMMESKKSIKLNESELIKLITNIVNESFPGAEVYDRIHKDSGKENSDALSDVEKKIKEYLTFDDNDNPEFPNQIGGEVKARRADEKEADEVATHRGGGLEDLVYDVDPGKEFDERTKKSLNGDTTTGNSQEAANVVPSKLGEKIIKKVQRKDKEEADAPMYVKDKQPVESVNESEEAKTIISKEIKRMKEMASYNKKTQ